MLRGHTDRLHSASIPTFHRPSFLPCSPEGRPDEIEDQAEDVADPGSDVAALGEHAQLDATRDPGEERGEPDRPQSPPERQESDGLDHDDGDRGRPRLQGQRGVRQVSTKTEVSPACMTTDEPVRQDALFVSEGNFSKVNHLVPTKIDLKRKARYRYVTTGKAESCILSQEERRRTIYPTVAGNFRSLRYDYNQVLAWA